MRRNETRQRLPQNRQSPRYRKPPLRLQNGCQVVALDVRHRDVLDAIDLTEVVNAHDVGVCDLPGQQQLAFEATLQLPRRTRVARDFGSDDLQRNGDAELAIPRLVDGPHAAHAEQLGDAIPIPKSLPNTERPGVALARP